ncbi:MAG: hypothetical protein NZ853_03430 [Leptospiraceae bacterium]|nr:hypothetical protein [Leptospiraceae bacterium]MDW7975225.1 hypothetical protein [Leptospiraceae bacterium]
MKTKKSTLAFLGFSFFVLIWILYSQPSPEEKISEDKEALALLFGGSSRESKGTFERTKKQQSLYDTEFWKEGVKDQAVGEETPSDEEEPEILEKVSEGNPINPQTGLPYTDEQMEAFDRLRQKFPNNSLIPRRMTPEEKKVEEDYKRRMLEIQSKVSIRSATAQEIEEYYQYQKKPIEDRIELLKYVLQELQDELTEEMIKQYQEVLRMNEQQLKNLEEQKKILLRTAM